MASPTSRVTKIPERLKKAVRTPIRDWEQPGLDNTTKALEEHLAKKRRPKPEKP